LDIFIRFENIPAQSEKMSEIGRNLACFSPSKFFCGQAPNFRTGICKLNMLLTMWQNFAEIGPRTSEISRWKN